MTSSYPVELLGGPSGLSAGQMSILYKTPFTDHLNGSIKIGARQPRKLVGACGLWYGCSAPMGDWSGTSQDIDDEGTKGSGGPAGIKFSMAGLNTILAAGHIAYGKNYEIGSTGHISTSTKIPLEKDLRTDLFANNYWDTWTVKLKYLRKTAHVYATDAATGVQVTQDPDVEDDIGTIERPLTGTWTPGTKTLLCTTAISNLVTAGYRYTGDDWCWVTGGSVLTGWYRIAAFDGTNTITLTDDAELDDLQQTDVEYVILESNQAKWADDVEWRDYVTLQLLGLPTDGEYFQIGSQVFTWKDTPAANGDIQIGVDEAETIANLEAALVTFPAIEVVFNGGDTLSIRSATRTQQLITDIDQTANLKVDESQNDITMSRYCLYKTSAFTTHVSDDDTLQLLAGTGIVSGGLIYSKVIEATAHAVYVSDDLRDSAAEASPGVPATPRDMIDLEVIQWLRHPWIERTVTIGDAGWQAEQDGTAAAKARAAKYVVVPTLDGTPGHCLRRGDAYVMWADTVAAEVEQETHSNPEACPTITAESSRSSWWPYGIMGKIRQVAYPSTSGVGMVHASYPGTQMNHSWWGTFLVPPEGMLNCDKIEVSLLADFQPYGTDCMIEVLLWPGFDPEANWSKESVSSYGGPRLPSKVVWFQSPIIRGVKQHNFRLKMEGMAGSVQTIGSDLSGSFNDNYSMQWFCTFNVDNNDDATYGIGGGSNSNYVGFPITRTQTMIVYTDAENFAKYSYPWTFMIKVEHPTLRNQPGMHGYFPGEPFSCTTGNGGTLLHQLGQSPVQTGGIITLPYGGSFRISAFEVLWTPGGMY